MSKKATTRFKPTQHKRIEAIQLVGYELWLIRRKRTSIAPAAVTKGFRGISPVSNGSCRFAQLTVTIQQSGEAESGSAGEQLDEEYPGSGEPKGLPPLADSVRQGFHLIHSFGHRIDALENPFPDPTRPKELVTTDAFPG